MGPVGIAEGTKAVDAEPVAVDPRKVFVVHGRNDPARKGLFEFLRSIDLDPIEWSEALHITGQASPYIGDVLDAAFGAAQAVVVLQTPDDVAHLHESLSYPGDPECSPQMQPRPNVLFEAGMAMGRNADRTVIVELGHVKSFSDIHGRHVVRLDNTIAKRQALADRLKTAGCSVKTIGSDWHEAGDLTPPAAPGGGLPLGRKLPSSQSTGLPRLQAQLRRNGGNKMDEVVITNHGPGDVYDLAIEGPSDEGVIARAEDGFPVPKLPPGKSVRALRTKSLGHGHAQYFTVVLTARTADGTEIREEEFVSGS
jgi:predicted nucleotide-binding protein